MSRTDAHVPYYVRARQKDKGFIEVHNHRNGECDLDIFLSTFDGHFTTACRMKSIFTGVYWCGCSMCSPIGPEVTRHRRTEWRNERQKYLKGELDD